MKEIAIKFLKKTGYSLLYIMTTLGSIGIAVDCAIIAIYYAPSYLSASFIITMALAGFILNLILYYNDAFAQIQEFIKQSPFKSWKDFGIFTISLLAGIGMGVFTYNIYLNSFITLPLWIVVMFSIFYTTNTLTLMRKSLENISSKHISKLNSQLTLSDEKQITNQDSFKVVLKKVWGDKKGKKITLITSLLSTLFITATIGLGLTWAPGITLGLQSLGLSVHLSIILHWLLVVTLVTAEIFFCIDKGLDSAYFILKISEKKYGNNSKLILYKIAFALSVGLVLLNCFANGLIAGSLDSTWGIIFMLTGCLLSGATMLNEVSGELGIMQPETENVSTNTPQPTTTQQPTWYDKATTAILISLILVATLAQLNILPITPINVAMLISLTTLVTIISVITHKNSQDNSTPPITESIKLLHGCYLTAGLSTAFALISFSNLALSLIVTIGVSIWLIPSIITHKINIDIPNIKTSLSKIANANSYSDLIKQIIPQPIQGFFVDNTSIKPGANPIQQRQNI